jgi:hypothetical protein
MATAAPQATPPPSTSFINIEDFDSNFPGPETTQRDVRNAPSFNATVKSNVVASNLAGSEAGGSTTSSAPDLSGRNWIGKLLGTHSLHIS